MACSLPALGQVTTWTNVDSILIGPSGTTDFNQIWIEIKKKTFLSTKACKNYACENAGHFALASVSEDTMHNMLLQEM